MTEPREVRRRRFGAVAAGVGVLVIVLLVGAVVVVASRARDGGTIAGGAYIAETKVTETPGLAPRRFAAQAAVGENVFVYGGEPEGRSVRDDGLLGDAALVRVSDGQVDPLPDLPFDEPLHAPTATAVEGGVVVAGLRCDLGPEQDFGEDSEPFYDCQPGTPAAAHLDLADRRWREIPMPARASEDRYPEGRMRVLGAEGAIVGFELGDYRSPGFVAFDTKRWSSITLPSSPARAYDACVTGDRIAALTLVYRTNGVVSDDDPNLRRGPKVGYEGDGYVQPRIASIPLAGGEWKLSQPLVDDFVDQSPPILACGPSVAFLGRGAAADTVAVHSLETGTTIVAPPPPERRYFETHLWTDTELVLLPSTVDVGRPGFAFDPATGRWRTLEGFPPVTTGAVWSGDAIVGYSEPVAWTRGQDLDAVEKNRPGVFRYVPASDGTVRDDGADG